MSFKAIPAGLLLQSKTIVFIRYNALSVNVLPIITRWRMAALIKKCAGIALS